MVTELAKHNRRFNYVRYAVVIRKSGKLTNSGHSDWNESTSPTPLSEVIKWLYYLGQTILEHLLLIDNFYLVLLSVATLFVHQGLIKICNSFPTVLTTSFFFFLREGRKGGGGRRRGSKRILRRPHTQHGAPCGDQCGAGSHNTEIMHDLSQNQESDA